MLSEANLKQRLLVAALMLTIACAPSPQHIGPTRSRTVKPNVVFVIIDDLGWKDLGVTGSTFHETPNLDRFFAEGARFSQFYTASGVCSPTRASMMSGKAPARVHITDWIGGDDSGLLLPALYERQLPLAELTIGEAFRDGGYETGYIGKWHLGDGPHMPERQGFEFTRAVNHAGQPASFFPPYRAAKPHPTDVPDLEGAPEGEYLTDRLTTEALRFIATPRTRPFFLVLSHYAVHTPLQAPAAAVAKYTTKRDSMRVAGRASETPAAKAEGARAMTKLHQDHAAYAAMVESVDESMGRLLGALDSLGLGRNTIVVFVSDNGGLSTLLRSAERMPTSNTPLRAGKGWLYEGGIRAPLGVRWPGVVPAGRVIDAATISTDLYPTLLDLAGLPPRPTQHLDGLTLAPLLRGGGALARNTLHWHFPHYHSSGSTPSGAIRRGSLKLIEWFDDDRVELYDLASDPSESSDLSRSRPQVAAELRAELARWRADVGANMPRPRPPRESDGDPVHRTR